MHSVTEFTFFLL